MRSTSTPSRTNSASPDDTGGLWPVSPLASSSTSPRLQLVSYSQESQAIVLGTQPQNLYGLYRMSPSPSQSELPSIDDGLKTRGPR